MVRIAYRNGKGTFRTDSNIDNLPALLKQCAGRDGMLWVDLFESYDDKSERKPLLEVERLLRETFAFHPLAIDDALTESHVPKVDDWGDYLYIVLHAVVFDKNLDEIDTRELDVFLGRHYIVTYHHEDVPALEREWSTVQVDDRHGRRGPDYLLYHLCDAIATDYLPCMEAIDEVVDDIQDQVFEEPSPRLVARVLKLKQAVLNLRRILSPQREVLSRLARDAYAVIDEKDRIYFRDIYDHFVRLVDLNESSRDIIAGALDTYLSVTANRTNEVMKALTIVTTLFMPLSFITGFFGMNFFGGSTEVVLPFSPIILFGATALLMVSIPVTMIMYVRRRGWW
ncbi:MAG: magnesium/cobalt transporter CorA [Chloroflexi bacterium]|nr:magnesium/cobalt transporter CorA [Chloroflexota bacterium]